MGYQIKQAIAQLCVFSGLVLAVAFFFGPWPGLLGCLFVALTAVYSVRDMYRQYQRDQMARGRKLASFKEAEKKAAEELNKANGDKGVLFGKIRIPTSNARWHFCITGAVGSGKTLTIRMMMRDQLPLIKKGSNRRAMIYDAKQDMLQIVYSAFQGEKPECGIRLLNPFDKRAHAWDMSRDIKSPAVARQFATTLIPESDESQPFFTDAVRELLIAVLLIFIRTRPDNWTFRQVLLVMSSKDRLNKLLSKHDYTREVAKNFLESGEKTVGSIMATVATKLGPFEPIAAAWEHARKAKGTFSITEWLKGESILILGNDERIRASLDVVNQLFVAVAAQHVLSQPDNDDALTWFFFDEFREAGKLPGLESIILRGRSKGCAVVLGFQDIQGIHHVYKKELGNELVGQCGNKAFLRIESPDTADWAAKSIGEYESYEYDQSWQKSQQGTSETVSASRKARYEVLASEFMNIPVTNEMNGLEGVYLARSVGAFRVKYTPDELNTNLGKLEKRIQPFESAPTEWQYLERWSTEDDVQLGLADEPSAPEPNNNSKPKQHSPLDDFGRIGS